MRDIAPAGGLRYAATLPPNVPWGDDLEDGRRSDLRLFEDEHELGPGHAEHTLISALGGGRYSHWGKTLYFSTSDGSDPRSNGRTYRCLWSAHSENSCRRVLREALETFESALEYEHRYALAARIFEALVPGEYIAEHSRALFRDAGFRADYERFGRGNYRSFDRKFALRGFAEMAADLPGDFAECGVFKGASAFLLAKVILARAPDKTLHLFDSFAGLSLPGPRDGTYWREGALAADLTEVVENLADVRGPLQIHAGWIPERFSDVDAHVFALVHVDVDLYEPTLACLQFFAPRLVPGGMIVCDDYGFETCPGARLAVDEYVQAHRLPFVHLPTGQAIVFATRR